MGPTQHDANSGIEEASDDHYDVEYGLSPEQEEEQEQLRLRQMVVDLNEADKLEKFRQNAPRSQEKDDPTTTWTVSSSRGRIQQPTTTADASEPSAPQEEKERQGKAAPQKNAPRLPGLTQPQQSLSDVRHPGIGQILQSRQQSGGWPSERHQQSNDNNVASTPGASDSNNNEGRQHRSSLPQAITEEEPVLVAAQVDHIGPSVAVPTKTAPAAPTSSTTKTNDAPPARTTIQRERAKTRKIMVAFAVTIVVIAVVATIVVVATTSGGDDDSTIPTSQQQPTSQQPTMAPTAADLEVELFGDTYPIDTTTRLSRGGLSQPISGSIPSTIGLLTALTYLGLSSHSDLTGTIPTEIGLLRELTHLGFVENPNLTGTIPTEIGLLLTEGTNNLESLWLQENQLSGTIPSEIGGGGGGGAAVALIKLSMNGNQLSGDIPTEIGLLTTMDLLDLSLNQLSGSLPSEIGLLTNLRECAIAENQLSSKIPSEIGFLSDLVFLAVQSNQLSGEIPSEIGRLSVLDLLYLRDNAISGMLPSELALLTSLRKLFIESTQLAAGNVVPTSLCPNAHTIAADCETVDCKCGQNYMRDHICQCRKGIPLDWYHR